MSKTVCGLDCSECPMKDQCAGCAESGCRPFGENGSDPQLVVLKRR